LEVDQKRLGNSVSDVEMLQHVYRSLQHWPEVSIKCS